MSLPSAIVKREGVSLQMTSRAESFRTLMGTKKTMVSTGHVYVGKGKSDGAPIVIVPLLGEDQLIVGTCCCSMSASTKRLSSRENDRRLGDTVQ